MVLAMSSVTDFTTVKGMDRDDLKDYISDTSDFPMQKP